MLGFRLFGGGFGFLFLIECFLVTPFAAANQRGIFLAKSKIKNQRVAALIYESVCLRRMEWREDAGVWQLYLFCH